MGKTTLLAMIIGLAILSGCASIAPNMVNHATCDKLYGYPIYKTKEADIALLNALTTLGKVYIRNYPERWDVVILDFDVVGGQPTKVIFRFGNENKLWEFSDFGMATTSYSTQAYRNIVTNTLHANTIAIGTASVIVPMNFIKEAASHDEYFARIYTTTGFTEGKNSGSHSLTSNAREFLQMIKTDPCEK